MPWVCEKDPICGIRELDRFVSFFSRSSEGVCFLASSITFRFVENRGFGSRRDEETRLGMKALTGGSVAAGVALTRATVMDWVLRKLSVDSRRM